MAFKEVQSLDADNVISLGGQNKKTGKKNPTQVEGYFLGSKTVPDKKKKSGEGYIHVFQTAEGNIGVWGKTDLDRKLASAPLGAMVRATHSGFRATPNGDMYTYKVEVDEDNSIDVNIAEAQKSAAQDSDDSTEDDTGAEDTGDDDVDSDDVPADEQRTAGRTPARAPARATDPGRAAATQALLGSRKRA